MKAIFNTDNVLFKIKPIQRVIRKAFTKRFEKKYFESFFKKIDYSKPNGKKILVYAGIGHMYITPLETLIYNFYKAEGYEVDYMIYDENCRANEVISLKGMEHLGKEKFWRNSVKNAKRVLSSSQVDYKFIFSDPEVDILMLTIQDDIDLIFNFEYDSIPFGEVVKNTLYRYYRSISEETMEIECAKNFLHTALSNYFCIKKLHETNKYDCVFFSHGIYCTWAPVVAYCRKNNLRFISYDRGKKQNSMNFNINNPSAVWNFDAAWDRYKDKELNGEEKEMVKRYFQERELQTFDVYAYNFREKEKNLQLIKEKLSIASNKRVITIYTNLLWDAANISGEIAFSSPLDCIIETIKYFENRENIHIVIRPHPAEKVLGTKQTFSSLLYSHFKALPGHVSIAETHYEINSFNMIEISDISVVHTSTIGLEVAMMNKPIVLISDTHFRNKGFTFDATSPENYFLLLENILKSNALLPDQQQLAEKYFYMMMFLYQKKTCLQYDNNIFNSYYYKDFTAFHKNKNDDLNMILNNALYTEVHDFIKW